jgi:2-oxoglutarate dehydrogenase E1 component
MDFGVNQGIVEELYFRYRANPRAVAEDWRKFFDAMSEAERSQIASNGSEAVVRHAHTNGNGNGNGHGATNGATAAGAVQVNGQVNGQKPPVLDEWMERGSVPPKALWSDNQTANEYQERVTALVQGYRMRGHRFAQLDPLGLSEVDESELSLERFGLADVDPDTVFATGNFAGRPQLPLREIVRRLRETYTRTIGVEFRNIEEPEIRSWMQEQMEPTSNRLSLTPDHQVRILSKLIDAEIFEQFLHTKYVGAKRFSLEGAESLIPLLELVIEHAGADHIEEVVIGMAHRGRLNVMANVMEKSL